MEPDLISKKDLLAACGISYGQLYRWKRKGLIPEEWFERRSTFTGTETFFPRERMLARVEKIKSMKDEDLSLDDIAEEFSPDLSHVALTAEDVVARGIASRPALELFAEEHGASGTLVFDEVLAVRVLDRLLSGGDVTADEGRALVGMLEEAWPKAAGRDTDALLLRKLGFSAWLLVPAGCELAYEGSVRVVARVNMTAGVEELKAALR
ncbi:MAG TPA: YhbD family protein [Coriobacteriia bacterium]|jgi:hypothetical protein